MRAMPGAVDATEFAFDVVSVVRGAEWSEDDNCIRCARDLKTGRLSSARYRCLQKKTLVALVVR